MKIEFENKEEVKSFFNMIDFYCSNTICPSLDCLPCKIKFFEQQGWLKNPKTELEKAKENYDGIIINKTLDAVHITHNSHEYIDKYIVELEKEIERLKK